MSQVFAETSLFKNDQRSEAEKLETLLEIALVAPEALTLGEITELSRELLRRLKVDRPR